MKVADLKKMNKVTNRLKPLLARKNFPTFIRIYRWVRWIVINILYYIFLTIAKLKKKTIRLAKRLKKLATRRNLIILIAAVVTTILIYFAIQKYIDWRSEQYTYQALVQIYELKIEDPVEDARATFKFGDVMAIFPKGHQWSDTEIKSYLLLKLKISPEEAALLTQSDEKKTEITDSGGKTQIKKEIARLRSYRVKMNKLKFNPENIWKGQPFDRKVFTMKIVEKK